MDSIDREILIAAPVQRVWQVITEAPHVGTWFSESAQIDLRVGGRMVLHWKEHGTYICRVERFEPPHLFAYRGAYQPETEPAPGNSTLVEFTLSSEGDGTRLRVVESGFSALEMSTEEQAKYRAGNIDGWRIKMDDLHRYLDQGK